MLRCLIFATFLFLSPEARAQTLTVTISGIRTSEGDVRVSFFCNQDEFDREAPRFERVIPKGGMKNGKITLLLTDLPPGTYGIAVLDDANGDGEMNYHWWKPAEGYGFSNCTPGKLRKPQLADFSFTFGRSDQVISIEMVYW